MGGTSPETMTQGGGCRRRIEKEKRMKEGREGERQRNEKGRGRGERYKEEGVTSIKGRKKGERRWG